MTRSGLAVASRSRAARKSRRTLSYPARRSGVCGTPLMTTNCPSILACHATACGCRCTSIAALSMSSASASASVVARSAYLARTRPASDTSSYKPHAPTAASGSNTAANSHRYAWGERIMCRRRSGSCGRRRAVVQRTCGARAQAQTVGARQLPRPARAPVRCAVPQRRGLLPHDSCGESAQG